MGSLFLPSKQMEQITRGIKINQCQLIILSEHWIKWCYWFSKSKDMSIVFFFYHILPAPICYFFLSNFNIIFDLKSCFWPPDEFMFNVHFDISSVLVSTNPWGIWSGS